MFFQVFAVAGHETTRSTASHFINLMNRFPEQYELLREDLDGQIDNAIEEVLRYTSTTTNFRRTTTAATEIGGVPVEKGAKILMSYAGANRDPDVFEDPHQFDITRQNARKHLAFGTGPHVCIGARLARLQLKALLKQIVTRLPDIRVVEAEWLKHLVQRDNSDACRIHAGDSEGRQHMSRLVERYQQGLRSPGIWLNTADSQIAEIATAADFDWVCIDLQHGLAEMADLPRLLPILEKRDTFKIVRVLSNDAAAIGRVFDLGANGVIVPMIETVEEAAAVERCRYPPTGSRSWPDPRDGLRSGISGACE